MDPVPFCEVRILVSECRCEFSFGITVQVFLDFFSGVSHEGEETVRWCIFEPTVSLSTSFSE